MFNRDTFVADCLAAVRQSDGHKAVRELITRAISDRASVIADLGDPGRTHVDVLHC